MTPRYVALGLGVAYLLLTAIELLVGEWSVGGATILERTTKANLLHWGVALALLGSVFGGKALVACRVAGFAFLALTAWGLLSASSLGGALGFPGGIPVAYQVLNALTAATALAAGFLRPAEAP